jgi:6-phosphogluconate dehydrogenase
MGWGRGRWFSRAAQRNPPPPWVQPSWRRVVSLCAATGIACPSLSSSLGYLDQYRRARLPANLTQAQRDFFGAHTYERVDKAGAFHTEWAAGAAAGAGGAGGAAAGAGGK